MRRFPERRCPTCGHAVNSALDGAVTPDPAGYNAPGKRIFREKAEEAMEQSFKVGFSSGLVLAETMLEKLVQVTTTFPKDGSGCVLLRSGMVFSAETALKSVVEIRKIDLMDIGTGPGFERLHEKIRSTMSGIFEAGVKNLLEAIEEI